MSKRCFERANRPDIFPLKSRAGYGRIGLHGLEMAGPGSPVEHPKKDVPIHACRRRRKRLTAQYKKSTVTGVCSPDTHLSVPEGIF